MAHIEKQTAIQDMILGVIHSLKKEAENIVADYWDFVQQNNEGLRSDKKIGLRSKEKPICFGPRVEMRKTGGYIKYVPNWVHYPYDERRFTSKKVAKQGKRIKMSANKEYQLSTLLRYSTGSDDTRIVQTETQLMAIREKLEMYHQALVSFDRRNTRIKRIHAKYQGEK